MASVRLTELGVERLRPDPAKRLEIADSKLTGLYFVVQPSGSEIMGGAWPARRQADQDYVGRLPGTRA